MVNKYLVTADVLERWAEIYIWYFTNVLQLSRKIPLQDSRSYGRDPPHLTLNHGFPIIRLSRLEEIA